MEALINRARDFMTLTWAEYVARYPDAQSTRESRHIVELISESVGR